jgi:uncharacterized protein (TIGR02285 family)
MSLLRACLLALLPLPALAQTVTWLVFDAPPMYIRTGPLANHGSTEVVIERLIAALPQYRHRTRLTVFARGWYDLEREDGLCIAGVSETAERERIAAFSRTLFSSSANRLITLGKRAERFAAMQNAAGRIDLDLLGRAAALRGAYAPKRSYGTAVTRYLNNQEKNAALDPVPNEYQLFSLLVHDRIDYFFGYKAEVTYYSQTFHTEDIFISFPVEGDEARIEAHVACSGQALGRAVVADVDRLLADPAFVASIKAARSAWDLSD